MREKYKKKRTKREIKRERERQRGETNDVWNSSNFCATIGSCFYQDNEVMIRNRVEEFFYDKADFISSLKAHYKLV